MMCAGALRFCLAKKDLKSIRAIYLLLLLLLMIVVTVNGKDLSKYEVHLLHQTYILQKDARQWNIFPPFQANWGTHVCTSIRQNQSSMLCLCEVFRALINSPFLLILFAEH